jgi:hypothetical protein
MKSFGNFIILFLFLSSLTYWIYPYFTDASPESIANVKALADSTNSDLDNQALIVLLKESPIPTINDVNKIEKSVIQLLTIEQSRELTKDTTILSPLEEELNHAKIISEGKQLSWEEKNDTQKIDGIWSLYKKFLIPIFGFLTGVLFCVGYYQKLTR